MFYYFTQFSDVFFGFNIFKYITFRAAMAAVTTFLFCMILGPVFIRYFHVRKIRENAARADCPGLAGFHGTKEGIPTMGGVFIVTSIVLSVLLWADLSNRYVILALLSCIYLAVLGGIDDYLSMFKRKQRGLRAGTKLLWQVALGCFIGGYLYKSPDISSYLNIPFFKDLVLNLGLFYIPFVALVIIGTSNAVNLTDGLDGLAVGNVLIVSMTLAVLCYITGHTGFAEYLFIPFVPGAGELTVFCAAIVGASLGFLWFNSHPATIFMGDTGALALGGSIGAIAVFIQKEFLLLLLGGVFVLEAVSVILQVLSVRYRKKKLFKMAPFHHHLQLCGWHESKIIIRFWILGIVLALLTLVTLKLR